MAKPTSLLINMLLLHSFSHSQIEKSINITYIRNKCGKTIVQSPSMNKRGKNIIERDESFEANIHFQNIAVTLNNTNYEKYLKFWAFGSHFKIYLKKQKLFHPHMTITSKSRIETNIEIPMFYVGFNYDPSLSVVHGRFYNNTFNGTIHWNNNIIIIYCPDAKIPYNHFNVILCTVTQKVNVFETNNNNSWDMYYHEQQNYENFLTKSLPQDCSYLKNKRIYSRFKRSVLSPRSCHLHLVADHLYFRYAGSSHIGSTVDLMMVNIAQADTIFRRTDFDGDGFGDNIGFVVANITIHKNSNSPDYKLGNEHMDVYEYIKQFSEYDFSNYCLAVAFTYREFENGVVGLAWLGQSSSVGRSGGICDTDSLNDEGELFSYNTLLLSQLTAGEFYPTYMSSLALTHELGHSFGAVHDEVSSKTCAPNDDYGNYIMYPFVITGSKPNNKKFSPCSIQNINPVITKKGYCIKLDTGPVCGNAIREEGEQCDCGTSGTCHYIDPCCSPSDADNMLEKPCKFRAGKICSPKESPCCAKNCQPVKLKENHVCKLKTDCAFESYCDGKSSSCPVPVLYPDGTSCNGGRMRCEAGKCSKSICEWLNLKDCQCISHPSLLCYVCCMPKHGNQSTCAPVGTFEVASDDLKNLRSQHGQPCNQNKGFCDHNYECIMASIDSVNTRLNKIFGTDFQQDIKNWFRRFWILVFAFFIFILILTGIFTMFFKKYQDTHVEALRVARLTTALEDCILQKHIYYKKIELFKEEIDRKINQLKRGKNIDSTEALARLSALFPAAPILLILEIMKFCPNEEIAVRYLLLQGFHMRAFKVIVPYVK